LSALTEAEVSFVC